jgi:uncharacterized protein YcaQ
MIQISNLTARKLALHQQGLLSAKPKFGRGKKAVLTAIEHLGYVQIDAISVIQRAHHHTLWSRVPAYKPKYLHHLLSKDRAIFEYWSHAAAFLPMKDYLYALPVMKKLSTRAKHWYEVNPEFKTKVFETIKHQGPMYARDFETPDGHTGGMWSWKPAKQALHELFMEGRIAVKSRDSFHRLYDISERVIPDLTGKATAQKQIPSIEEYLVHRCRQAVQAHGLVTIPEIRYQRYITSSQVTSTLETLGLQNLITPVKVDGSNRTYFTSEEILDSVPSRVIKQLHFLSPFDNAVIQRKRVLDLFDFDYQTEIYYPVNKRRYGYFSLPILYGTDFIGRMDPKAHRDRGELEIRNLALRSQVTISDQLVYQLRTRLKDFADFNGCHTYHITRSRPEVLKSLLN